MHLQTDAFEMDNLALKDPSSTWYESFSRCDQDISDCQMSLSASKVAGSRVTIGRMLQRLDALLLILKDCKGRQCTQPWKSYFPSEDVGSLADALNPKYDSFFADVVANVDMEECTKGYIPEMEGPAWNSTQVFTIVDEVWTGPDP